MPGAMYWEHIVGIGAANPVTKQLQNVHCGIGKRGTHITKDGARGTTSMRDTTAADGPYAVDGPLAIQPSDDEWDELLQWILGGTRSGAGTGGNPYIYPKADTCPERYITQEKKAKVFTWAGNKPDVTVIRSSAASPVLTCEITTAGKTQSKGNAGTFPAISASLTSDQPFLHQHLVCTLNGNAVPVDDVVITLNRFLIKDRFLNSQTRTDLPEAGFLCTVDLANPYTVTDEALYDIAIAGIAGTLVYTNGSHVLSFSFANLKSPADILEGAQRGEVMNRLKFTAFETSVLKEIVTSLVMA